MIRRTLRFLWGKKFLVLTLILVMLLLPDTISRDLQVRTTTIITQMTIDNTNAELQVTAKKFKSSPGSPSIEYDTATFQGTDIRAMLSDVSLAHCTNIDFVGEPDIDLLHAIYKYQDLRTNTMINNDQTMDELLKNHHCCYQ